MNLRGAIIKLLTTRSFPLSDEKALQAEMAVAFTAAGLAFRREVHKQLAGRLRPRPDPITEIYIVADGGSDPLIAAVQGLKAGQVRGIVDPKRGVEAVATDESRIKALAKAYLERK